MTEPVNRDLLQDAVAYIDRWVEHRQRSLRVPGVAIAVGLGDQVLLSRAYGVADLDQNTILTTDHIFRIASHSKTFTATAIMQLVENGTLRLDDRAAEHLAWLPAGSGQLGRASIRQLLCHSAGVIRDGEDCTYWDLERDFPDVAELRENLVAIPPVFPVNKQFKYSNFGFSLLGMIIEQASGRPYNDYVRSEIIGRLGLRNTGPEIDAHARECLATGHTADFPGVGRLPLAHIDTHGMASATGFYSTVEDVCRYAAAHCIGNEELLTDESKREMQREHWRVDGVPKSYGLGFVIASVGERRTIGHSGGFPGFVTNTLIDSVEGIVVTALTNAQDGPAADITFGMFHIINRALATSKPRDSTKNLDRFTGRFWSVGDAIDIVRFGGDLLSISPGMPNPFDPVTELEAAGDDELKITRASGFSSPGERIKFEFGHDGRVERMDWAGASFYPWETFESVVLASIRATGRPPKRQPTGSQVLG